MRHRAFAVAICSGTSRGLMLASWHPTPAATPQHSTLQPNGFCISITDSCTGPSQSRTARRQAWRWSRQLLAGGLLHGIPDLSSFGFPSFVQGCSHQSYLRRCWPVACVPAPTAPPPRPFAFGTPMCPPRPAADSCISVALLHVHSALGSRLCELPAVPAM